jgi:hypothetical protein
MDLFIEGAKRIVIIECKLTDVEGGRAQLEQLYFPIAEKVWPGKRPLGIVAARHLSKEPCLERVRTTLKDAIKAAEFEQFIPTLHWMERMPL